MSQKELSELTNEDLLLEGKKIKSGNIMNAVLFGVMIGVATWSTVKYGLGIITFFPLLFRLEKNLKLLINITKIGMIFQLTNC